MKFQKILCLSFFLIVFSLIANILFRNHETPFSIKFYDFSFTLIKWHSGLGTLNFSREKYNQIRDLFPYFKFYSEQTHVEHLKVPSLYDEHQIEANLFINKSLITKNQKLPTIIYIHGGGWILDYAYFHFFEKFTEKGFVVIEVTYRLAPENKFPIPLDDCFSVVSSEIIYKYSDKSRLALLGDSAGGNLVSALILLMREKNSEILKGIQFAFIFYPTLFSTEELPSHKKYEDWYIFNKDLGNYFKKTYARQEIDYENPYFNPLLSKNLGGWPEIYMVISKRDYFFSDGKLFAEKLRDAGNRVTVKEYDIEHGFLVFPIKEACFAVEEILYFLKEKNFSISF